MNTERNEVANPLKSQPTVVFHWLVELGVFYIFLPFSLVPFSNFSTINVYYFCNKKQLLLVFLKALQ